MRTPNIFTTITAAVALTGIVPMANGQETPDAEEIQKWKDDKVRYEAEKAAHDAKKAAAEAKLAALKAQIGEVPDSGYSGDVTVGEKAGETEAALLSAKAVVDAAQKIAGEIPKKSSSGGNCENSKPKILLYSAAQTPNFQAYVMFNTQLGVVNAVLDGAGTAPDGFRSRVEKRKGVSFAAPGLALSALNKILGYFRTDYAVSGVALTFQDSMLVHALAGKVAERCYDVQLPAVYNPAVHSASTSAIVKKIVSLAEEQQRLKLRSEHHHTEAKKEDVLDEYKTKHLDAAQVLDAAVALCDAFFSKLTTPVNGKTPLSDVVLQTALVEILKQGGCLLIVKIQQAGGGHYTKKNLWTFFGRLPFFHMGGAVVSYVLINGCDGSVKKSGVVPIHGGFKKADKVEKHLKN